MTSRLGLTFGSLLLVGLASASPELRLSVSNEPRMLVISWSTSATDWELESATGLSAAWNPVSPAEYQTNGPDNYLQVAMLEETRFYRLRWAGSAVAGLTGYWQWDEGVGQVSRDGSGAGAVMQLTNANWTAGRIGAGAVHFEGNGWAWVSNVNYSVLPPTGQPFSASLWFSPDSLTNDPVGIMGNANASNGWYVALENPGPGTNLLVFASTGTGASLNVTGRTLLLPGQWHQLTVTHDGVAGSIYLDGAWLARGAGNVVTHDGLIFCGGGIAGYDGFIGRMDDVRVYTNSLSAEQISLTGDWRFDEHASYILADSSIYGHRASVTEPVARVPGKVGNGIELSAGRVRIPNDYYGVLPPTGGPFSISAWLRPHDLQNGRSGLMDLGEGGTNGWQLFIVKEELGVTALHFTATNNGGTLNLWTPITLSNNVWTKLDLTFNGGIATVYVNGNKIHADNGAIQGSRSPLVVGASPGATNFSGIIDDLKIYCRERDAAEMGPIAQDQLQTVFLNSTTNFALLGRGPAGKTLTYSILSTIGPTNGTATNILGSPTVTYQAAGQKGPDAFAYTVSDGEFTSPPAYVWMSVVAPHWLSPGGGAVQPLDGNSPEHAWAAGPADALDGIWRTNNYYDCFFYAPGEYQSRGWKWETRSTANPGCKHIGSGSSGSDRTVLKLVDAWDAMNEGVLFAALNSSSYCDGFEVHDLVLDCNGDNVPKFLRGEPVWLRIPLVGTGQVDTVTLRWGDRTMSGNNTQWRTGRAAEFSLCAQRPATNGYVTNCTSWHSTGQVDVVTVNAEANELVLQLELRADGVDFYGLTEIEVSGPAVSLPSATIPGGGESKLDAQHTILQAVDGDGGSWWASGAEDQVQILLPLAPATQVSQLNLRWNCGSNTPAGWLGPAANYLIRARNESTGQFEDVPFVRQGRQANGFEASTFGTAQSNSVVVTDQLLLILTSKESWVNHYSLYEVALQNGPVPVPLRLPTALNSLSWGGYFPALRAFDQLTDTEWTSATQGGVMGIDARGRNMKFVGLRIIGFGTKAARECFPIIVQARREPSDPTLRANVWIEDCIIADPATNRNTDGVSAMVLLEKPLTGSTTAVIRRCTVAGLKSRFPTSQAFGAVQLENCLVEDCHTAVYYEPDVANAALMATALIRSNQFFNVDRGIHVLFHPGIALDTFTCLGNEIVLTGAGGGGITSCDTCLGGPSGTFTNLTALNNIIRYSDWALHPTSPDLGLYYSDIQHAVFGNNLIVQGTTNELRVRHYPAGVVYALTPPNDCNVPVVIPPGTFSYVPSVDVLRPGYRRAWFNNRGLSGTLLPIRTADLGVDHPAAQQQWPE